MPKYLYNGVELPDINSVWTDKASFPYAFITTGYAGSSLVLCTVRPYCEDGFMKVPASRFDTYSCSKGESEWTFNNSTTSQLLGNAPHWSSIDILNADGSVWFVTSEPVPVDPDPVPVARESDFYVVANRQWVKHSAVKPADGEWVAQDEYLYTKQKAIAFEWDGDLSYADGPYDAANHDYYVVHLTDHLPTYEEMQTAIIMMHDPLTGTDFLFDGILHGLGGLFSDEYAWYIERDNKYIAKGISKVGDDGFNPVRYQVGIALHVFAEGGRTPDKPYIKSIVIPI